MSKKIIYQYRSYEMAKKFRDYLWRRKRSRLYKVWNKQRRLWDWAFNVYE